MRFPWSKKTTLNTLAFRVQLDSVLHDLRLKVSDVDDDSTRAQLIAEVEQMESAYRNEIRQLSRPH